MVKQDQPRGTNSLASRSKATDAVIADEQSEQNALATAVQSLQYRFLQDGQLEDLTKAISLREMALVSLSPTSSKRSVMVKDLTRAYYEGSRQEPDLDDARVYRRFRNSLRLFMHAFNPQSKHPDGLRDAIVFYIEVIATSGPPDHDGLRRLDQEIAVILSQRFLRPNNSDEDRKAGIFHVESAPRMIPYHRLGRREELVASMIIKIAKVFEIGPIDDVIDLYEFKYSPSLSQTVV
ncbi:hypothetical protein C8J56DRAFT_1063089 [Mycena floridula]|nr:hypothetical protein C8J56DRAFT_1063089 [Mycena floridula]